MKEFKYFLAVPCLLLSIPIKANAAHLVFGNPVVVGNASDPDNNDVTTYTGDRFGYHSYTATSDGFVLKARSGVSATLNPLSYISNLSSDAVVEVRRTFTLVPDKNETGGSYVRLTGSLIGNEFGGTGAGFSSITEKLTGSYKAGVSATVIAAPFKIPAIVQPPNKANIDGTALFITRGEFNDLTKLPNIRTDAFLNYNQTYFVDASLSTSASKQGLAESISDFGARNNQLEIHFKVLPELVPEPSSALSALTFGALNAGYLLKRHWKNRKSGASAYSGSLRCSK